MLKLLLLYFRLFRLASLASVLASHRGSLQVAWATKTTTTMTTLKGMKEIYIHEKDESRQLMTKNNGLTARPATLAALESPGAKQDDEDGCQAWKGWLEIQTERSIIAIESSFLIVAGRSSGREELHSLAECGQRRAK